ncbi:hypothetical protein HDV02_003873 [Globomyces sp. JEL0801]|nr:hypothetical protein HDV02_003873 [Globomyces sp. JEL0801]
MFINYSSPKTIVLETKIIDPLPRDRDEMVEVKFTTEIQDAVVDVLETSMHWSSHQLKRATSLESFREEAGLGYYFYVSTLLFSEITDLNRATTQAVITRLKADLKLEDAQSVSHEKFWSIDNDSEEEEPTASDRDEAINQDAENTTAEERLD